MNSVRIFESLFLQDGEGFRITELETSIELEQEAFVELIDCDLLSATWKEGGYRLNHTNVQKAKRAARLARDFELAPAGLTLALKLFERIEALEAELAQQNVIRESPMTAP